MGHKIMTDDPKSIVATGYDLIADGYWSGMAARRFAINGLES
jgi:hypothetical protein